MAQEYNQALFALAHTNVHIQPMNNHSRTLRLIIESNIDAYALTVRFSNLWGQKPLAVGAACIALCDENGVLLPGTLVPLTVGGVLHFELPAEGELISDTVRFPLKTGELFALSIYYPTNEPVDSGNWVATRAFRSPIGNFTADLQPKPSSVVSRFARTIMASDLTVSITSVCEIIASCERPNRVVGCFGDSITQQGNWLVPFTKRLYRRYPGEISICNLGISGNRLLADSAADNGGLHGYAGIHRFGHDLLYLSGLTHAIVEIGTNDIGQPGMPGIPESDMITLPQYITAMTQMADLLHEKGVRVYTATLIPRPIAKQYTVERERLRFAMNDWIRSADCFDAVLDFDAAVRRDDENPGIKEGCALPDGLHPSPIGGLEIAKSIDLSLFGGDADE